MTGDRIERLGKIGILGGLSPDELERIDRECSWQKFEAGSEIISQQEPSTDLFFVATGCVAAKGYSKDGKEVMYTQIVGGEVFGEFSAIDGQPRSASIEAIEHSLVGRLSSGQFRALVQEHASIGLRLVELLVAKNRVLTTRLFEYYTMVVRQRLASEILRLVPNGSAERDALVIDPAPSHYEFATKLGTHREAISKELAQLAKLGMIKPGRRKIFVLDLPKLRALTQIEVARR